MSVNEVLTTRLNFRELLMYFIPGFFLMMVILVKTYNIFLKIHGDFWPDSQQTPYLIMLGVLFLVVSIILGVALDAFSHVIADIFDRVKGIHGIKNMKKHEIYETRFYYEASSSHISIAEEFFFLHNLTLSISLTIILSIVLLYTFPPYIIPFDYFWLLIVGGIIFLLISIYWRRRNIRWIHCCISHMRLDINMENNKTERNTNREHQLDTLNLQSDGPQLRDD